MEKHSININLLGRQFPATVDSDEAEVIQDAAELINKNLRSYKVEYASQDDLDLALMCCLEIMTDFLKYKLRDTREYTQVQQELDQLNKQLDQTLDLLHESQSTP